MGKYVMMIIGDYRVVTSDQFDLFGLASCDGYLRGESLGDFLKLLDFAGELAWQGESIKPMVVVGAYENQQLERPLAFSYERGFNFLFEALEQLVGEAGGKSVTIAIENPGSGLLLSPLELRELIDQVNNPYLGICFNPCHAQRLGDPIDWLRILGRRIVALRLPEKQTGDEGTSGEVGSDFEQDVLSECKRFGFSGPIIYGSKV